MLRLIVFLAVLPALALAQTVPVFPRSGHNANGAPVSTGDDVATTLGRTKLDMQPNITTGQPDSTDPLSPGYSIRLGGQVQDSYGGLIIRGLTRGPYDNGALVSIVNTGAPVTLSRARITGGFDTGGIAAIANYPDFDAVNIYNEAGSTAPRLSISGVTYDAMHVFPPSGGQFTAAQIKKLAPFTWVMTNSIDLTAPTTPATPDYPPPLRTYGGIVASATPFAITLVSGWTVPGSGHTAAGQVPTAATPQVVTFGSPTKMFGANSVQIYDPTAPGSSTRAFEQHEYDSFDYGTVDGVTSWKGLTLHQTPFGLVPAAGGVPQHNVKGSPDGWALDLSDGWARLLHMRGFPGNPLIDADSMWLNMPASPLPPVGSQSELVAWQGYVDTNRMEMRLRTVRDVATAGPMSTSVHFGVRYDGTFGTADGTGSPMAELVWNPQTTSGYGGMQMCSSLGQCVTLVSDGRLVMPKGGVTPAMTVATLPACNSAYQDAHMAVTDAASPTFLGAVTGGGSTRTPVYCNGSAWVAG